MRSLLSSLVIAAVGLWGCGEVIPSGQATPSASPTSPTLPSDASPTPTPTATAYAGVFSATGPMTTARYGHQAVILAGGSVLVIGGKDGEHDLVTAELYDPAGGTFATTGSMSAARWFFTATLLQDGRALIAGGQDLSGDQPVAAHLPGTAELYVPTTRAFSPAGAMTAAPRGHTATLLRDGRVLIAGGSIGGRAEDDLAGAELYEPPSSRFVATGSMSTPRSGHTATLLTDGRVLVVGGSSNRGGTLASAEVYDPDSGTFAPAGRMTVARSDHTATLLPDGRVLITGGLELGVAQFASAELWDPRTGAFGPTTDMTVARRDHVAILLADGRVLIAGGHDDEGLPVASAELYDPVLRTFTAAPDMTAPRWLFSATLLLDGRVLIAGGGSGEGVLASAEWFN